MVSTYGWNYFYLCTYRRLEAITNTGKYFGLEASAWYWHSVDVVGCSYINCIFWASYGNADISLEGLSTAVLMLPQKHHKKGRIGLLLSVNAAILKVVDTENISKDDLDALENFLI